MTLEDTARKQNDGPNDARLGLALRVLRACFVILTLVALVNLTSAQAADTASDESRYYRIVTIPIPAGIVLEAGALQFMPDGKLAVSTRLGDIYLLENVLDNPPVHVKF